MATPKKKPRSTHPLGAQLRNLRYGADLSLQQLEETSAGQWKAVVVGSYERGDRRITVERADELLARYGRQLAVVPLGMDIDSMVAELERLRAFEAQVIDGYAARHGLHVVPERAEAA